MISTAWLALLVGTRKVQHPKAVSAQAARAAAWACVLEGGFTMKMKRLLLVAGLVLLALALGLCADTICQVRSAELYATADDSDPCRCCVQPRAIARRNLRVFHPFCP